MYYGSAPDSDMLEIIFAHRNKAYGAYQLRRSYTSYLMRAFALGILFLLTLLMLPRIMGAVTKVIMVDKPEDGTIIMTAPPVEAPAPPPPALPAPPPPPPPARAAVQFVPPAIVDDANVPPEVPQRSIDDLLDAKGDIGKKDIDGDWDYAPDLSDPVDGLDAVEYTASSTPDDETFEVINIHKLPSFPGGDAALMQYLRDNINYPALARENNIQGTVALSFVVNKDGTISTITVLKDPGGGCAKEAVRVVGQMPQWSPGEAGGRPVKVRMTLPVRFRLSQG